MLDLRRQWSKDVDPPFEEGGRGWERGKRKEGRIISSPGGEKRAALLRLWCDVLAQL